jgi:hypothetical protein
MQVESPFASNGMLICIGHDQSMLSNDCMKDGVDVSFFLASDLGVERVIQNPQLEQKVVGPGMASCTLP